MDDPLRLFDRGAEAWRDHAACRDHDPDLWFPIEQLDDTTDTLEAKAICRACPVRGDCLEYSLATNQADGIWGGLDEHQRRSIRRRRRRTA